MTRKEKILSFISDEIYIPLKANELATVLCVPKEDYEILYSILDELESEGKISKTKKGKYILVSTNNGYVCGELTCNSARGFGFVKPDESGDDIFVPSKDLNGAYDGDRVLVRIDKKGENNSHSEGHIIKIIKRGNVQLVGVVAGIKSGKFSILPDKREFFSDIIVPTAAMMGAKRGDRVLVKINKYTEKHKPIGEVLCVLGNKDSIMSCLDGIMLQKSLTTEFPENVMDEVANIPDTVDEIDKNREDLRDKIIFTIDGTDSRDFDDAVSLETLENGNKLLGVHIADVTHYVKENSALDNEAFSRSTSVYFPHTVVPMLPKALSNGICSLNPDVDRLTLSVFMEIDKGLNIINPRIAKSVIHSKHRMTYDDVNRILQGDMELKEKYCDIADVLFDMNALSKALAKKRKERGAIDFDFAETKVICDSEANPIEVVSVDRGDSERMIESFMLLANETVAEIAFWAELPFVYRVHESPSNEKITDFNNFIKNFGYSLKGKPDSESIHPKELQEICEAVKGIQEEAIISKMMLRSLMKACYRENNDGHFGLAARYYCHFTSPIRRYPDLMIHRILKDFADGKLNEQSLKRYENKVKEVAMVSSEREVEAEDAERNAVDMLKATYMKNFVGESFDAVISSVTSFGMFAMLSNSCEGLIRYETISDDYYNFDEQTLSAHGERSGKTYKIGDGVRITVASSDILSRRIDFVLENDGNIQTIRKIQKRNLPQKAVRNKEKKRYRRR